MYFVALLASTLYNPMYFVALLASTLYNPMYFAALLASTLYNPTYFVALLASTLCNRIPRKLHERLGTESPKKLKKTRIFTVEKSVTLTTLTPNDHFSASFVQNHVFSRCIFILLPPLPNETLTFDPILSPN
jgi:hypothetical protein